MKVAAAMQNHYLKNYRTGSIAGSGTTASSFWELLHHF